MGLDAFDDLTPDSIERVQAGHWFLKNHRDCATSDLLQLLLWQTNQLLACEFDGSLLPYHSTL